MPALISKFAPINIWAITIGPYIFCKGELSKTTLQHEKIHAEQWKEMYYIFFLVVYYFDYLHGFIKYRNNWRDWSSLGEKAYMRIRFEQEAYCYQKAEGYLETRPSCNWKKFKV